MLQICFGFGFSNEKGCGFKTCKIYSVVQHVHCTSYMAPPQKRKYLIILQFFPEFYQKKSRDQSSSTKNTVSHNKSSNLTTDGQMRAHIHTHTQHRRAVKRWEYIFHRRTASCPTWSFAATN